MQKYRYKKNNIEIEADDLTEFLELIRVLFPKDWHPDREFEVVYDISIKEIKRNNNK